MNITERDIFNFVFDRSALQPETIDFLESTKSFKEEIAFYESLKKTLNESLSGNLKKKIADRIPTYKFTEVIEFFPTRVKNGRKNNVVRYAADSLRTLPRITADTFFDSHSEYMIRVLIEAQTTKLFVFSISGKELKNFKVVLYPSGSEINCVDNLSPLEIASANQIEKINLVFN